MIMSRIFKVNMPTFTETLKLVLKRNDIRQDDTKHKKLREPLVVGKKVFVLAGRLKKKVFFIRVQLRINHFLTETRYFLLEELLLSTILIITGFQKQFTVK